MLRCKKGDLAICLKTQKNEHAGFIVEIVDFWGDFWEEGQIYRDCWITSCKGDLALMPDAWMLPIRPGDLKETEETEKEVESVG